jgi:carbon monoxide dehydrogenase subunit G
MIENRNEIEIEAKAEQAWQVLTDLEQFEGLLLPLQDLRAWVGEIFVVMELNQTANW